MDEIRAILRQVLEAYEPAYQDIRKRHRIEMTVKELTRRLKPYLKGPPVPVIKPEALKAWIDGTLNKSTEKGA